MICKNCGKEIDDDSLFCEHCGKNVSDLPVSHYDSEDKISNNVLKESWQESNTLIGIAKDNGVIKKYARKISLSFLLSITAYYLIQGWVDSLVYSFTNQTMGFNTVNMVYTALFNMLFESPYLICIVITLIIFSSTFKSLISNKRNTIAITFMLTIFTFISYIFISRSCEALLKAILYFGTGIHMNGIAYIDLAFKALLIIVACVISYKMAYKHASSMDFEG